MRAVPRHGYGLTPTPAERVLWHVGDGYDRLLRREFLTGIPDDIAHGIAREALRVHRQHGGEGWDALRAANGAVIDLREDIGGGALALAASDDEIVAWAARRAADVRRATANRPDGYDIAVGIVERMGLPPPPMLRGRTQAGALARMRCERWWRRAARRSQARTVEHVHIRIGNVSARRGLYASNSAVRRRREQKTRNRRALESMLAVNEIGQSYTLAELAELSVSNPAIRRGELMTRIAGMEQIADERADAGLFVTWTCPSAMHARDHQSGRKNPTYDGQTTPRDAQRHLCAMWARARAAIQRHGLTVYGLRVAEPHHDGTPHWHMLLFTSQTQVAALTAILQRYALAVAGNEPGAAKHRCTVVEIDRKRGTATGYVAKYIAKNIDAYGVDRVDEDLTGARDPSECAERVDAWASTWGIRQFQFVGSPPVTVWRELRRLRDGVSLPSGHPIAAAWVCADGANWAGYVRAQGGPALPHAARPVRLSRAWDDRPGAYGEPVGDVVRGVECGPVMVPTRVHVWSIQRRRVGDGSGSIGGVRGGVYCRGNAGDFHGVGAGFAGAVGVGVVACTGRGAQLISAPRSPVNNCTGGDGESVGAVGNSVLGRGGGGLCRRNFGDGGGLKRE